MRRLALTPPEARTAAQRDVAAAIVESGRGKIAGPLLTLLEHPSLCAAVQDVGRMLRFEGVLEPRVRELAILVVARFWAAEYEWRSHAPLALVAGVDPAAVEAIRTGTEPALLDPDRTVSRFCRALLTRRPITDADVAALTETLGAAGILELTALVGYYSLIAHVLAVDSDDANAPRLLRPSDHQEAIA